jgi:hypothetical protein
MKKIKKIQRSVSREKRDREKKGVPLISLLALRTRERKKKK